MDAAAALSSAQRLFEAFEALGAERGGDLAGIGPSPAPAGLVRQFEELLAHGAEPPQGALPVEASGGASSDAPLSSGHVQEDIPAIGPAASVDAASPGGGGPLLSISDFFQLQFNVAMARFSLETGSQIQQKTAQGFESLLKNQS